MKQQFRAAKLDINSRIEGKGARYHFYHGSTPSVNDWFFSFTVGESGEIVDVSRRLANIKFTKQQLFQIAAKVDLSGKFYADVEI